jgi:HSP20 family protein
MIEGIAKPTRSTARIPMVPMTAKSDASINRMKFYQRKETAMPQQAKAVTITKKESSTPALKLVPPTDLFKRVQQLHDEIAKRAFEIFDGNGRSFGRDLDDWFKAESEILHPVNVDVVESDGNLILKAEVPGFTDKELEISLEPRRVTITGKRETKEERKDKKLLYSEIRSNQVLRVLDLPAAVDAERAAATLKDGVLELRMPKAAPAKNVEITAKQAS